MLRIYILLLAEICLVYSGPSPNSYIHTEYNQQPGTCHTQTCFDEASRVNEYMDSTVDPCSDFYQFACGGFIEKYSDAAGTVDQFTLTARKTRQQLTELLMEDSDAPAWFKVAQNYYKSCVNADIPPEKYPTVIRDIFRYAGGWPFLEGDDWDPDGFDIFGSGPESQLLDGSSLFLITIDINTDRRDASRSRKIISIGQFRFGSWEGLEEGFESEAAQDAYNTLLETAQTFGVPLSRAEEDAKGLVLAQIEMSKVKCNFDDDQIVTIRELSERIPSVPWLNYIRFAVPKSVTIDFDEPLSVPYLECLPEIVAVIQRTPKRQIANYMGKYLASAAMYAMGEASMGAFMGPGYSRGDVCLNHTAQIFDAQLARYYSMKYSDEDFNQKSKEVLQFVKDEVKNVIRNINWISGSTKNLAVEWIDNFTIYNNFPEEPWSIERLQEIAETVQMSPDSYALNTVGINLMGHKNRFYELRDTEPSTFMARKSLFIGAENLFLSSWWQNIVFPVGLQQDVFFNKERPSYMNFGGLGHLVGELFSKELLRSGEPWWKSDDVDAFIQEAQCFPNESTEEKWSDTWRLTEIASKAAALQEIHASYLRWVQEHGAEPGLPGIELTPTQLLWLASAQSICTRLSAEDEINNSDPYSFYVSPSDMFNTAARNSEEFSVDFECPPGSEMNLRDKCLVW